LKRIRACAKAYKKNARNKEPVSHLDGFNCEVKNSNVSSKFLAAGPKPFSTKKRSRLLKISGVLTILSGAFLFLPALYAALGVFHINIPGNSSPILITVLGFFQLSAFITGLAGFVLQLKVSFLPFLGNCLLIASAVALILEVPTYVIMPNGYPMTFTLSGIASFAVPSLLFSILALVLLFRSRSNLNKNA
jgi:hypothetical protein